MRTFGERATSFVRILKQSNWFNTYSTEETQIRREIITTRIYLILLPAILIILIIYSAERELDYTVQINNPTLDTYQQLLETYPDTLFCPCSQLSLSYSSFFTLTPQFHPVCSSDFIEDPWLSYLYHDDASFYFPFDIRSIGNAQFQLLRDLFRSTFICSANATWAKEAVTVASFANGSSATSLAGLNSPGDLFVDEIGNMYILDAMNYRILYLPKDSTEGRVVVGTGQPGSDANQLTGPISLTIGQNQMFISDAQNYRVQAFPLTTLSGSPNGTTVLGETIVGSNRTMPIIVLAMAFDHKNKLLYVGDYFNQRLLILNITEENVEIVTDVELSIMNSSIPIYPSGIAIDESSDIYYILDSLLNTVVKFQIGSTMGSIVAGDLISNSIYNQLALPLGLAVDSSGYLYIVDMGYNRVVQLLNDNGDLRTIAGIGFIGITSARLTGPSSIKFDQYYNLYVVDSGNNRIQRFDLLNNGCS